MTLLETLEYFLTETAADMDGLSWEMSWPIREETNFEDNNIEHLTECYDFEKQLYDNLKQIKLMIEEKDPVKQIINDPNDELIENYGGNTPIVPDETMEELLKNGVKK